MTDHRCSATEVRRRQAAELKRLYDAGASVGNLKTAFGLSHGTVLNRLAQAGTVMRTSAQTRRLQARDREVLRQAQALRLRGQYEQDAVSVQALAVQEGLSTRTVRRRLAAAGTVPRSGAQTRRLAADPAVVEARLRLAAGLRQRYERGAGVAALAAECGRSVSTVYRLLHEVGTPMRPRSRLLSQRAAKPP